MSKKDIIDAYCKIRTIDQTISDEVLNFMKVSAIEKLDQIEKENFEVNRRNKANDFLNSQNSKLN